MAKPKILVQLDSDPQPSVFDAVVATDCGIDQLLQHGGVTDDQVQSLVHGAMFTRGGDDLRRTAIFIGGSDVQRGEAMLRCVTDSFFGPVRVSVMMDASGANTTSAAAVVAAGRHLELAGTQALVLGATGPVGQRVVRLLAGAGAHVRAASRSRERAQQLIDVLPDNVRGVVTAFASSSPDQLQQALDGVQLVIAAGAAGVELVSAEARTASATMQVAIDLNAVPPLGIAGVEVTHKATDLDGVVTYGAIGVGGTKMQIHKACIEQLFRSNDVVLDIDAIYQLALEFA